MKMITLTFGVWVQACGYYLLDSWRIQEALVLAVVVSAIWFCVRSLFPWWERINEEWNILQQMCYVVLLQWQQDDTAAARREIALCIAGMAIDGRLVFIAEASDRNFGRVICLSSGGNGDDAAAWTVEQKQSPGWWHYSLPTAIKLHQANFGCCCWPLQTTNRPWANPHRVRNEQWAYHFPSLIESKLYKIVLWCTNAHFPLTHQVLCHRRLIWHDRWNNSKTWVRSSKTRCPSLHVQTPMQRV